MNDEQTKQTEFDPCEQALRDHADMIEKSCSETPQLRRRIKRLRKAADRIQSLREGLIKIRDCDFVTTPADRMDAVREIARETLKEAADG